MNLMGQLKENAKSRADYSNTNGTTVEKEHINEGHGYEYDYYVSDMMSSWKIFGQKLIILSCRL